MFRLHLSCPACGEVQFAADPRSRYGVRPLDARAAVRLSADDVYARCAECGARWKLGEVAGAEPVGAS